jgi:hypothetical protein
MDLNEPVRLAAVVVQAAAIVITAIFAVLGLRAWRGQLIGKRKVEIAEETLVLVYKIRNAIAYARLPVHGAKEGLSRGRELAEDENFRKLRDSYFVSVERLRAYDEDFAKLERQILLCEVYFEVELGARLADLIKVRATIVTSSRKLLVSDADEPLQPAEMPELKRCEAVIWDYGDFGDETTAIINKAVAEIERRLRPYLRS